MKTDTNEIADALFARLRGAGVDIAGQLKGS
jgi:hypothetical protein